LRQLFLTIAPDERLGFLCPGSDLEWIESFDDSHGNGFFCFFLVCFFIFFFFLFFLFLLWVFFFFFWWCFFAFGRVLGLFEVFARNPLPGYFALIWT